MIDRRLVDYIKSELSKSTSLEQIRQNLLSKGWSNYDINEAMNLATQQKTLSAPPVTYKEPAKKTPKKGIIFILIVIVIIGGIFAFFMLREKQVVSETPSQKQTEFANVIDCGYDFDCFIGASENCSPANVTDDITLDMFGMLITTTTYLEIKGIEANKCVLYLRTEEQNIDFGDELIQQMLADNITQEEIQQQKQEANEQTKLVEGKDGACRFSNNNYLINLLNKWKEGTLSGEVSCSLTPEGLECTSTGDWDVAECGGEMFIT